MSEEGDETLFSNTKRVREAISLMNGLDETKLSVVVRRLARALGDKEGSSKAFSEEEVEQLQSHLGLSAVELSTVLEACSYIFEKTAYDLVKPADLSEQLQTSGMLAPQARAIAGVWEAEAKRVLGKLRSASLGGTPRLKATEWQLHVQAARSDLSRVAEPRAIFQLVLDGPKDKESAGNVTMEFSKEELAGFLGQLDKMQSQLDSLN
mmetsp:Transcript_26974/g.52583  ORF Transcript_26974/g.52583 Transcript_26974/m.52583 type:complete len:208 (-) Transcript_26974:1366-1989(-)